MSLLQLDNITFSYEKGGKPVIKNMSYEFQQGKIYAVVGKSGAGKTTLLSLLSGLCVPTDGKIIVNDKDISSMDKYDYRSKYVGVVFQNFNLLPKLSAIENVVLSMDISGARFENKKAKAVELLKQVGLSADESNRRILKLSGGQQQRVAIARAMAYNPQIILADEPTGNLDSETQDEIMNIFKSLAYHENKCIIIVTHSPQVAQSADIILELNKK